MAVTLYKPAPGSSPGVVVPAQTPSPKVVAQDVPCQFKFVTCGTKRNFAEFNASLALNFGD